MRLMSENFIPPTFKARAFNCPHCGVFAHQHWSKITLNREDISLNPEYLYAAQCSYCKDRTFWIQKTLLHPPGSPAPVPNPDLPDDVKKDYEEARLVLQFSPRSAAALLRLAIQRLCRHLGYEGEYLNDEIREMVRQGLSAKIQQALDIVRVVGNSAVHPGKIDLADDYDTAMKLFDIVNIIARDMITHPRHIEETYRSVMPKKVRKAISWRDRQGREAETEGDPAEPS